MNSGFLAQAETSLTKLRAHGRGHGEDAVAREDRITLRVEHVHSQKRNRIKDQSVSPDILPIIASDRLNIASNRCIGSTIHDMHVELVIRENKRNVLSPAKECLPLLSQSEKVHGDLGTDPQLLDFLRQRASDTVKLLRSEIASVRARLRKSNRLIAENDRYAIRILSIIRKLFGCKSRHDLIVSKNPNLTNACYLSIPNANPQFLGS